MVLFFSPLTAVCDLEQEAYGSIETVFLLQFVVVTLTYHRFHIASQNIGYHFKRDDIEFPISQRVINTFRRATSKWQVKTS